MKNIQALTKNLKNEMEQIMNYDNFIPNNIINPYLKLSLSFFSVKFNQWEVVETTYFEKNQMIIAENIIKYLKNVCDKNKSWKFQTHYY